MRLTNSLAYGGMLQGGKQTAAPRTGSERRWPLPESAEEAVVSLIQSLSMACLAH